MEKSYENSVKASIKVKKIMDAAQELDIDYLKEALKDMSDNHSMRESASILNPNPFIHNEVQELDACKLNQLKLMIDLGENIVKIKELTIKLEIAKNNQDKMGKMFGF